MDQQYARNVAVIGAGYWGKNLIRNMHELGALHTICDVDEALLQNHGETYPDVRLSCSLQSVLADSSIRQVVVATPAPTHYRLVSEALHAGKDVYVEKPMCLDLDEGRQMVELAEECGRTLMVGHILQYHPCVQKMQEMVSDGVLGRLQHVTSNRLNLGKIQTKESALWALAPHDISVILSLCGGVLPESVRCHGGDFISDGVADVTLTTMRFADRVQAHIYVSWLNPFKEQKLVLVGSSGMLVFDDTKPWDEKLLLYREPVKWLEGTTPRENRTEAEKVAFDYAEPLKQECRHFLECCEKRVKPKSDGLEGLRVLSVLQAADRSLRTDGEIQRPTLEECGTRYQAHPTAVVDAGALVGVGTKIWHFSHIMPGAEVGECCNIGQNVVVSPRVRLGRNVKVQNNVSLYEGIVCEDDVFLGPSAVFTNIPNPRSEVVRRDKYQFTRVCRGATVGANATIVCGVTLGAYCFVGAGAVVTKDVAPYGLVVGNPARQTGWMSRYGERLDLPICVDEETVLEAVCPATGELYRLSGSALERVEDDASIVPSRREEALEMV